MTTFAVIILVIILIALSIGWAYVCVRFMENGNFGENLVACFVVTAIFIIVVYWVVKDIIIWGYPLFVT